MPRDENGQKWACSVCINGHRAPKCDHFERYMMRVRNPGRPLTTCPHINDSDQCDCQNRESVIMMRLFKGSQCLCARVPDSSGKVSAEGESDPNKENETSTPKQKPRTPQADVGYSIRSNTRQHKPAELSNNEHHTPQSQVASPYGQVPMVPQSGSAARNRSNMDIATPPYDNPSHQYLDAGNILPQQSHSSISPYQQAMFTGNQNPTFGPLYQDSAVTQYCPAPGVHHSLNNFLGDNPMPSANSVSGSIISTGLPENSSQYRPVETMDQANSPLNMYGGLPWSNDPALDAFSGPVVPHSGNFTGSMGITQQEQSLQHHVYQPWPVSTINSLGTGASAAEENRAQRYEAHICTCGPGCGCLACPIHPYNDATRKEALHVGRLLSQDSLWTNDGELEQMDSAPIDMPRAAIMYGDEWLEAQHLFQPSELMTQDPAIGLETEVGGRSCCQSANRNPNFEHTTPS